MASKTIYFTVTNDLSYDQRMHRICTSLSVAGFNVILVGRKLKRSLPLQPLIYKQARLKCLFNKGFLFYTEYNFRLFFYLLFKKMDGICAIDLDTILPCYFISLFKKINRIYDAHEYFTELKEVRQRKTIKNIWSFIEKITVPKFEYGYTVSKGLSDAFKNIYNRNFLVIRNLPVLENLPLYNKKEKVLLYQGAVNEGRAFEFLIPAMKHVPYKLIICGDGNYMEKLKLLIKEHELSHQIEIKGMLIPEKLKDYTLQAQVGLSLSEKEGLHQYFALPNKFFDYMHAGLPQLAIDIPEYQQINDYFEIAILLDSLDPINIAKAINELMENEALLKKLSLNCIEARKIYCWQNEEKMLITYYQNIFNKKN